MGLQLFLSHIICTSIKEHLVSAILNQVRHERDGDVIHRSTVKGCVDVLLSLEVDRDGTTVYKRDLEPVFLQESEEFYEREGERLVNSCDAPEFLRRVSLISFHANFSDLNQAEERFEAEQSRTNHYLSSQTTQPLLQILKDRFLAPHIESVISKEHSGLDVMIDNNKFDDLSRLFRLCLMMPKGMHVLQTALKRSIIRRGKVINQTSLGDDLADNEAEENEGKTKGKSNARNTNLGIQPAITWVHDVLEVKDKFDLVWITSFKNNREVEIALNDVRQRHPTPR